MSTLWANGDKGYKFELGATMQRTVLFNLTQEVYPTPTIIFKKKFARSAFFHNFASFQVNKCALYGQMDRGLKSTSGYKGADSTL